MRILCFTLSFFSPQCFSSPKTCWWQHHRQHPWGTEPAKRWKTPDTPQGSVTSQYSGALLERELNPGWEEETGRLPDTRSAPGTRVPWTHSHSSLLRSVPPEAKAAETGRGEREEQVSEGDKPGTSWHVEHNIHTSQLQDMSGLRESGNYEGRACLAGAATGETLLDSGTSPDRLKIKTRSKNKTIMGRQTVQGRIKPPA